jgi:hypothetical protein
MGYETGLKAPSTVGAPSTDFAQATTTTTTRCGDRNDCEQRIGEQLRLGHGQTANILWLTTGKVTLIGEYTQPAMFGQIPYAQCKD